MIRYFALHPTAANIMMVVFLCAGIATLPSMKRETFPDIEAFEVKVSVVYPGAAAADVEESICQPLEDATDGISFIDERRCEAKDNLGAMTLKMLELGDMQQFIDDINTAVDGIDTFPDAAEIPVVEELGRTNQVIGVAISADVGRAELKRLAEYYRERLLQHPDVPIVTVTGFSTHQLQIEIPDYNLRQYGLSVVDIADRVARQAVDLPAGDIESDRGVHQIRFTDLRRTPQQLAELIVIAGEDGAEVRLGDIATIADAFEEEEDRIVFNGRAAAILQVYKNKIDDSLVVFDAVSEFVERENRVLPEGIALSLTQDMASIVKDRLQLIVKNSWQGLLLVILALYLFFSWRYTFWVAMGLPVSFLGSFLLITWLGISINMISLVALLIAIGILMDDAIVISESIASEYQKGKAPAQAVVDGTKLVARGVLSSFVTTLLIFGGLVTLQGDIGQVLRVLPIVLISVLSVSLVEAFLILPHHLKHALERAGDDDDMPKWKQAFTRWFERRREALGRYVELAVQYRYAAVGGAIAVLLLSVAMLPTGILKFKAFPDLDGDVIQARILLPQGTALSRTEAVVAEVIAGLQATDGDLLAVEGRSLLRNINVSYNQNADAFEAGAHVATVSVDLVAAESRRSSLDTLARIWREHVGDLPGVINLQYKQPVLGPAGRALHIRLSGRDLEQLSQASYELQQWLGGYPGVVDIMDDLRPGKPQINVRMLPGTLATGISAETIATQLRGAYQGHKVDDVQFEDEDYEIEVQLDAASRDSLTDFDYLAIIHPQTRQAVPLSAIAEVTESRAFARIHRVDNLRTVSVFGDVDGDIANTGEVIDHTRVNYLPELLQRYPDVRVEFEGEVKNAAVTGQSLRFAFMLGALGIFLLLSLQFRNYLEPIIVMLAIPLALIGVIWGHLIMGLDLTMPSMIGFVSLAGIVVNDSILLVEFVKRNARAGMTVHAAACLASQQRFRAIFLTSFTTVAGVSPLLFETSLQAQVLVPLVTSIAFGIVTSTLLILIVLPAMYAILEDFGFTQIATGPESDSALDTVTGRELATPPPA
ncbi:efflux RND transporter permease subunit [Exilibacterium tricleocarpae]|uniref:Efflux RND transporter permease subunit n=1 Tax=Exilibacterium tricleocarpae TaxID=2591008 RepID=A0A545U9W9_9GAMM|nr:efflux RND transporter permease subunit [Exilibacterium tricleocarpae]TQV86261.1 efflux RND transporter permease subunit [Exilibacterium tricleocarpae]